MRNKTLTSIAAALLLGLSVLLSLSCHTDGRDFDNGPLGTLPDHDRVIDQHAQQMIEEGRQIF